MSLIILSMKFLGIIFNHFSLSATSEAVKTVMLKFL